MLTATGLPEKWPDGGGASPDCCYRGRGEVWRVPAASRRRAELDSLVFCGNGGGRPRQSLAGDVRCEVADGLRLPWYLALEAGMTAKGTRWHDRWWWRSGLKLPFVARRGCWRHGDAGDVSSLLHSRTLHRKRWERAQDVREDAGNEREQIEVLGRSRSTGEREERRRLWRAPVINCGSLAARFEGKRRGTEEGRPGSL